MSTAAPHLIGITKKEDIDIVVKYFRKMLTECKYAFTTTYKLSYIPNDYGKSIAIMYYNFLRFYIKYVTKTG